MEEAVPDSLKEVEAGEEEPAALIVSVKSSSWDEVFDETYQLHYYVHKTTGECQWVAPATHAVAPDHSSHLQESGDTKHDDERLDLHSQAIGEHRRHSHTDTTSEVVGVTTSDTRETNTSRASNTAADQSNASYKNIWKEFFENDGPSDEVIEQTEAAYGTYEYNDDHQQEQQQAYDFEYDDEYDEDGHLYTTEEGDDVQEGSGEHVEYAPYDEESAPPTVKNRSKDLPGGGTTQDYVHMARMYKLTRPYSDPNYYGLCLLCHTNFADMVYFPCEHRCVCSTCIEKENICSDSQFASTPDGYCNCSLCAGIIKLILPSEGGAEVEKYWHWVYEEPVPLPSRFMRDFRHSAAVIKAVHVRNGSTKNVDSFENASKSCALS